MKRLGWNIIYEPDIKGLNNWIPDFLIIGKNKKILVDVKPHSPSGIKNLLYELLILGTKHNGDSRMGLLYDYDEKNTRASGNRENYLFRTIVIAQFNFIDTCWNEAGTQLQWNTPTPNII